MSDTAPTAADHLAAADAAVAAARRAVDVTSTAAQAMRRHRDDLIRASGGEQEFADQRNYRSFAAAIAPPFQPGDASTAEDDLQGAYGLAASADDAFQALISAANAAVAAANRAQAHRDKLGA